MAEITYCTPQPKNLFPPFYPGEDLKPAGDNLYIGLRTNASKRTPSFFNVCSKSLRDGVGHCRQDLVLS